MRRPALYIPAMVFVFVVFYISAAIVAASPKNLSDDTWILSPSGINNSSKSKHFNDCNKKMKKAVSKQKTVKKESAGEKRMISAKPSVVFYCDGENYVIQDFLSWNKEKAFNGNLLSEAIFVSIDDPGIKKLFKKIGAFCNWSSNEDVLFIHSNGRDIYFTAENSNMKFKNSEFASKIRGYIKEDDKTFVPLSDLTGYLGLLCKVVSAEKNSEILCDLIPTIDEIYIKEDDGTRKLMFHTSIPVKYRIISENLRKVSIFFPQTTWSVKDLENAMGDFNVSYEEMDDNQGTKLTVIHPENWDGCLLPRTVSVDNAIELKPHFPLVSGYRSETLENIKASDESDGRYAIRLMASGPIHYFWRYNNDKKLLTVDFPLVKKDYSIPAQQFDRKYVKCESFLSFSSGYGASRMNIELNDNTGFEFISFEEDPYSLIIKFKKDISFLSTGTEGKGYTGKPENWGTVVIDPGHGGCDPGACNRGMGLREKDLTLDISHRLAKLLREMGWNVVMTRTEDRDVTWAYSPDRAELQARADVANVNNADLFISIHCNASTSSSLNGSSIHWCKEIDYALAQSMKGLLGKTLRLQDRGLYRDNFYVLSHTIMPAVLIETAFISNYNDASKLTDKAFRQGVVSAIAQGLDTHMNGRFARKAKIRKVSASDYPENAGNITRKVYKD